MTDRDPKDLLRVMLVDDKIHRREMLHVALDEVGCVLVNCVAGDGDLLSAVEASNPDVILIDIETPGRDTLESLQTVTDKVPRPMVMFSQDDDNRTIRQATEVGVSAYVVDGLRLERIRPIIDAAVARFQYFQRLESELQKARRQLSERKTVEKAKGIVMRERGLSEEEAYKALRRLAMDTNRKLSDVAQSIIEAASILSRQSFPAIPCRCTCLCLERALSPAGYGIPAPRWGKEWGAAGPGCRVADDLRRGRSRCTNKVQGSSSLPLIRPLTVRRRASWRGGKGDAGARG
ncbi:MAG: ANTAR domain-containing protein [Gammaproteobacteria bacterium]|nr:ANTAR domain-containing protein [Gammaproteobacteria bacterium]